MINKIGKITLYVSNQEEAIQFWTNKLNFVVKVEQPMGPNMKWVEIAPSKGEFTTFVLYDKELMRKQNPTMNVTHPNIMLSTTDIDMTWNQLKQNGVDIGVLQSMPYGKMFSFKDQDGNVFLVREDK